MRRNLVARLSLIGLVAWACQPAPEPATPQDDVAKTVEQAKEVGRDLALSSQNYQPVRFVSDIEKVKVPKPVTEPEVEEVVVKGPDSVQVDPLPIPEQITNPDTPPVVAPDSTPEEAPAPRLPSIVPRDAPRPEAVGRGPTRGPEAGPDWGTVIGVVIRGGAGDPGHCPRHRPPGGPGIIPRNPNR
jgi:hypothetical protein